MMGQFYRFFRETINMRKEGEIIGRNMPKKPVWKNQQTVIGIVNRLKQEGQNQGGHYQVGKQATFNFDRLTKPKDFAKKPSMFVPVDLRGTNFQTGTNFNKNLNFNKYRD